MIITNGWQPRVCEYTCIIKNGKWENVEGSGNFHQWGTTVVQNMICGQENGLIPLTVAIIENVVDGGQVVQVPPESLSFKD